MRVSPRSQPAKPALSRETVLEAGLGVLRAKGIEGVTMRAVAAELDTGAASLYVYMKNRQDLLNQMFDLVAGQVELDGEPDPERWREHVEALLVRVEEALERYPGIARVPLANVPTGPNATAITEHLIGLLRAGGVDDRSIAWFVDVVFLFVNATAYEASIYAASDSAPEAMADELREEFEKLDWSRYPQTSSMFAFLTAGTGEQRFRFGLRLLIEGLLHTPPPELG